MVEAMNARCLSRDARGRLSVGPLGEDFVEVFDITPGRSYSVHAVMAYDGSAYYLIADDWQLPAFVYADLFELEDASLPEGWLLSSTAARPILIGYPQLVGDPQGVERLIDAADELARAEFSRQCSRHRGT